MTIIFNDKLINKTVREKDTEELMYQKPGTLCFLYVKNSLIYLYNRLKKKAET